MFSREANRKSQKSIPFVKMAENHRSMPVHIKILFFYSPHSWVIKMKETTKKEEMIKMMLMLTIHGFRENADSSELSMTVDRGGINLPSRQLFQLKLDYATESLLEGGERGGILCATHKPQKGILILL